MLNRHHLSVLIPEQAKKYGDRTAMTYRSYEQNRWLPISWNQFSAKVTAVSRSLLALGVERQERIAIFSQNKPESLFVAFGGYGIRAVSIPFYATSSGAQVIYMMNDAEVRYLFVGEQQQYDTAADVIHQCNSVLSFSIVMCVAANLMVFPSILTNFSSWEKWATTTKRLSSARARRRSTTWPISSIPAVQRAIPKVLS